MCLNFARFDFGAKASLRGFMHIFDAVLSWLAGTARAKLESTVRLKGEIDASPWGGIE